MSKLVISIICVVCLAFGIGLTYLFLHVYNNSSAMEIVANGPSTANIGDPIEYTVTVKNPSWFLKKTIFNWGVISNGQQVSFKSISNNDILFTTGQTPQTYTLVLSGTLYHSYFFWGSLQPTQLYTKQITIGGPTPGPTPVPPGPVPPVPVVPTATKLFGVVVLDMNSLLSLPASQQAIHTSETIGSSLATLNTTLRIFDKQNPSLAKPNWTKRIAAVGVPLFVVMDAEGNVYHSDKLPADEATLVGIVKTLRGQ